MILTHWSDKPVTFDPARTYTLPEEREHWKPAGLWFDVDEDWRRWCEGESFRLRSLAWRHVLTVKDWNWHQATTGGPLLKIQDAEMLDYFTGEFVTEHPLRSLRFINWREVQRRFGGIIIAPYLRERRFSEHCFWYYTWDCASGCIWDLRLIDSFSEARPGLTSQEERNTNETSV